MPWIFFKDILLQIWGEDCLHTDHALDFTRDLDLSKNHSTSFAHLSLLLPVFHQLPFCSK